MLAIEFGYLEMMKQAQPGSQLLGAASSNEPIVSQPSIAQQQGALAVPEQAKGVTDQQLTPGGGLTPEQTRAVTQLIQQYMKSAR